ncbi:MAG: hypothetical protein ABWY25_07350 [Paenisporosarcina sp.]
MTTEEPVRPQDVPEGAVTKEKLAAAQQQRQTAQSDAQKKEEERQQKVREDEERRQQKAREDEGQ